VFLKTVPDAKKHLCFNVSCSVLRVAYPEPYFEIDRTVSELGQLANRFGIFDDPLNAFSGFDAECHCFAGIGIIRDSDRYPEADTLAAERPVLDARNDQLFVRYQMFNPVAGNHGDIPGTKRLDPAISASDANRVARFDRLVHQQNDAADEIADNLLQPEADTHAQCATEDGKGGQVDTNAVDRDKNGDREQCDFQECLAPMFWAIPD